MPSISNLSVVRGFVRTGDIIFYLKRPDQNNRVLDDRVVNIARILIGLTAFGSFVALSTAIEISATHLTLPLGIVLTASLVALFRLSVYSKMLQKNCTAREATQEIIDSWARHFTDIVITSIWVNAMNMFARFIESSVRASQSR